MNYAGTRVTIMGLGRHGGGLGATRYLVERGAIVTVTDTADEDSMAESLKALNGVPVARIVLGHHDERDFRESDIVVVNPAVKPDHPLVALARYRGATISSEIEVFLGACPCPIVGVTGTNGKSSTCAMLSAIFKADGRRTWLGGNIGRSLLGDLPTIHSEDVVVLELSSFQLHWLNDGCRMPEMAVVTNCTPNHLDWHGTWEHYVAAKQRLVVGKHAGGVVLNTHDAVVAEWTGLVESKLVPPWDDAAIPRLAVAGQHQRQNATLAATAAFACSNDAIVTGLKTFRGLPHRIEFVAEKLGRRFYNDSKSTTPEATLAALSTFDELPWLLAGGYDKGVNLQPLCAEIVRKTKGAAFFGATGSKLAAQACEFDASFSCCATTALDESLRWCMAHSKSGDTILLSPASASHDQFRDYVERGDAFVALVRTLG